MNLTSSYAGIELSSPVVIGSSPLAMEVDRVQELESNGVGAIVMPSIFEEQIMRERFQQPPASKAEQELGPLPSFGPDLNSYNGGVDDYLRRLESAKSASTVPIIASINCVSTGRWMEYANEVESAGADAIELNLFHYEVSPSRFADEIEKELIDRAHRFCDATRLPVAIKLLPQFTSLPNVVFRLAGTGAKSVCLFGQSPVLDTGATNHIGYRWRLTTPSDLRVSLEGIHLVREAARNLTVAASGGIQTPDDALVALKLGANVVMLTSAIYRSGSIVIRQILDAIEGELSTQNLSSLRDLIGSLAAGYQPFPEAARRQDYTASLAEFKPTLIDRQND